MLLKTKATASAMEIKRPQSDQSQNPRKNNLKHPGKRRKILEDFHRNNVEVCGKEDGFLGSYYEAKFVGKVSRNKIMVEYKTLGFIKNGSMGSSLFDDDGFLLIVSNYFIFFSVL